MKKPRKREPEFFLNREVSWLEFNGRVLEEATDPSTPLLERLKFATIVASNLDEFFMVRVAALKNALEEGDTAPDPAGLTPTQQLQEISVRAHAMVGRLYEALGAEILPGSRRARSADPPRGRPRSFHEDRPLAPVPGRGAAGPHAPRHRRLAALPHALRTVPQSRHPSRSR